MTVQAGVRVMTKGVIQVGKNPSTYGTVLQLAEKSAASRGIIPQRLKPDSLQSI
jgi:hypothetical protein